MRIKMFLAAFFFSFSLLALAQESPMVIEEPAWTKDPSTHLDSNLGHSYCCTCPVLLNLDGASARLLTSGLDNRLLAGKYVGWSTVLGAGSKTVRTTDLWRLCTQRCNGEVENISSLLGKDCKLKSFGAPINFAPMVKGTQAQCPNPEFNNGHDSFEKGVKPNEGFCGEEQRARVTAYLAQSEVGLAAYTPPPVVESAPRVFTFGELIDRDINNEIACMGEFENYDDATLARVSNETLRKLYAAALKITAAARPQNYQDEVRNRFERKLSEEMRTRKTLGAVERNNQREAERARLLSLPGKERLLQRTSAFRTRGLDPVQEVYLRDNLNKLPRIKETFLKMTGTADRKNFLDNLYDETVTEAQRRLIPMINKRYDELPESRTIPPKLTRQAFNAIRAAYMDLNRTAPGATPMPSGERYQKQIIILMELQYIRAVEDIP